MLELTRKFAFLMTLLFVVCPLAGCDEEVMEVETPSGEIEVEETPSGALETEVDD